MENLTTNMALTAAVEEHPCLYDNTSLAYSKHNLDSAWAEVAKKIGIPAAECKDKWKNLRWGFTRSLRPNADGSAKKKYYLHDQMEFIIPFMKHSKPLPFQDSDTDDENMRLLSQEVIENSNKRVRNHEPLILQPTDNVNIKKGQLPNFFDYGTLAEPLVKRERSHEPIIKQTLEGDSRRMFLLSLLPEVNVLTENQMMAFRRRVFKLIDDIVADTNRDEETDAKLTFQTEIIKTEILD